jgi:hypothetical protein
MANKRNKTNQQEEARRALGLITPRLEALGKSEILRLNLSIPRAAATALAAEPKIKKLAKAIERELPQFRIEAVRELRPIALATWYLHVAPRPQIDEDRVKALVATGAPLKRMLLSQAKALAERKLLHTEHVDAIEKGRGNLDLANDLLALAQLFRNHWELIRTKVAIIEADELARAEQLGTSLLEAIGARHVEPEEQSAQDRAIELRARAATLLLRTYDELRAAVAYLRRHEGDADTIAPSLYQRERRRPLDEPMEVEVEEDRSEPDLLDR